MTKRRFTIRTVFFGVAPRFVIERGATRWVEVLLPAHKPTRARVYEERRRVAETICRMLNEASL